MTATVTIYTTPTCGFCAAAKRLLSSKQVAYEEIDVASTPERRREMEALSGRRTVPQVFINGEGIGGYDDLAALESQGTLDALLGQSAPGSAT